MLRLMLKYPWEKITVLSICTESNVSRTTFYSHFRDKDALLEFGFERMRVRLSEADLGQLGSRYKGFRFLPLLLEHVYSNHRLFYQNNTTYSGYPVAVRFQRLVRGLVQSELNLLNFQQKYNSLEIAFISSGVMAVLVEWAGSDCDRPITQVVEMVDKLVDLK